MGNNSFDGCTNISLTSLPQGLTSIGAGAFNGCTSLAITEIPEGVTVIEQATFANCTSIEEINLNNVETIKYNGTGVFWKCTKLRRVYAPKAKTIAVHTFGGCTSLEEVQLGSVGNPVTTLGGIFTSCTQNNLTIKVYIADGTT